MTQPIDDDLKMDEFRAEIVRLEGEYSDLSSEHDRLHASLRTAERERDRLQAEIDRNVREAVRNTGHREMPPGVWFYHVVELSKRHWSTREEAEDAYRQKVFPGLDVPTTEGT